jgi:type I restriction enzyme S subunit
MSQNWKTYKLGEIANVDTGFAFKSNQYEDSGELKVIRGKNITEGHLRWGDDARYWNLSINKLKQYLTQEDDIVIGMDGSKIGKNRAILRSQDVPSILAQRVARVRARAEVSDQKYLWQLINNSPFESYVENVKTGTSIPHISMGQVRDFEINLPPLPEQQSIASILSAIDDKIELNLATNRTLEQMAMALYKHWFVDFGPFQLGNFIDSELGPIPEGWEVKRLDYVLEIKYGKDHKKLPDGSIPLYGSGGIMRYVDQHLYDQESILIPRKGTLSNLFYLREPFWSVDTMFYSKVKLPNYGKYVFHFLRTTDLASMDVGSAIPSLTTELLNKIELIIPDQQTINRFDTIVSGWFNQMDANKQENQTLTTLRDTLLPKLISGAIRVKDAERTVAHAL